MGWDGMGWDGMGWDGMGWDVFVWWEGGGDDMCVCGMGWASMRWASSGRDGLVCAWDVRMGGDVHVCMWWEGWGCRGRDGVVVGGMGM